jgi:WD40 repeat protein
MILVLGVVLQYPPEIAKSQNHLLTFEREIGVGWELDKGGWMSFVSFSPDGTMVASDDLMLQGNHTSGNLTLWRFPDGQFIRRLPVQPRSMSGDWTYYADEHGVAEMESGRRLIALDEGEPAAFSPDSRYVVASTRVRGPQVSRIRVVELPGGKQLSAFGRNTAFALAISPDNMTVASGYWDIVALWNMFTGQRLAVLRGAGRYVEGLSFSRDGRLLAAATDAGSLQLWDTHSFQRVWSLDLGGGFVSTPAFSPDGRFLAVGVYGTGAAWLVDVGTGKIVDHAKVSDLGCGSVAFSPDGRYLITPSTGGLIKWPYDRGGTIRVFKVSNP